MEKHDSKTAIFETMSVPKAILTLAVPTIISQLISVIYNLADAFYVGRTGDSYKIAGVSLCLTVFMMTVAFANLFGIGGGSLVARLLGRKDSDEARSAAAFSLYGAAAIGLLYSLVLSLTLDPLLRLLGASDATILFARQYVIPVVIIGGPPSILSMVMAHLLRNTGYSRQASIGLSGGGICNMILDPLFMFVLFPKGNEVLAAGIATMISNFGAFLYLFFTYRKVARTAPLSADPRRLRTIRPETVRELFSTGIPTFVLTSLFDLANVVFNARISAHGDLQLAAAGIVMKIERLPNAINVGLCQGMLPIVAYNYASGDHERMKSVVRTARLMGLTVSLVCVGLLFALARPVSGLFISQSAGAEEAMFTLGFAASYLRIRCFASPVQFLNYHPSYCLQAIGAGRETLFHAVCRDLVFYIPMMIVFDLLWAETGLMLALPIGEGVSAILAAVLLRVRLKKHRLSPQKG
ncbi:MAG: cation transporter [Lachnospiraceae bacterium]|nr:cation transporter [Lachnospiraceae bacterium]